MAIPNKKERTTTNTGILHSIQDDNVEANAGILPVPPSLSHHQDEDLNQTWQERYNILIFLHPPPPST